MNFANVHGAAAVGRVRGGGKNRAANKLVRLFLALRSRPPGKLNYRRKLFKRKRTD